ncbi:MAG: COX15/CtaA family protein [Bacteroidota bacterium]
MKRYRNMVGLTVGAVIFLILVGGIVRSTGSGMGCPDWPKCFGQWVPPTDVSQLPANYKEVFQVAGKEIADFSAFKTWVEYVNRLLGVLIGFFALLTVAFSIPMRKIDARITQLSIGALLLVIIQGGIGAIVVRTHLEVSTITIHMMIALVIMMVYIYAWIRSRGTLSVSNDRVSRSVLQRNLAIGGAVLLLTLLQIGMGTQVREQVDLVALEMGESQRESWIAALSGVYDIHKLFHYVLTFGIVVWIAQLKKVGPFSSIQKGSWIMVAIVAFEIGLGLWMHHGGIPAIAQPLHLLGASGLIAAEFALMSLLFNAYLASTSTPAKKLDPQFSYK